MNVSPIELQKALHGVEYPASSDDLVACAERNGAGPDVLDALRALPAASYDGPDAVSHAVADAT